MTKKICPFCHQEIEEDNFRDHCCYAEIKPDENGRWPAVGNLEGNVVISGPLDPQSPDSI